MKRSSLEIELERVSGFDDPSPELEQYVTPPRLASRVLHVARMNRDLGPVVDLGCGTGVLGIGAALLGTRSVGVDVDGDALVTARRNARRLGVEDSTDWIRSDVSDLALALAPETRDATVVMNPPFGARNRGADRPFLEKAEEIASVAYTVHNEGSLDFVEGFVDGDVTHGFEASVRLPRKFDFHTSPEREIDVEVYRIEF